MNRIEDIRNYMGGDNDDVPVYQPSVDHLQYLIDMCNKHGLPLPEIFPWYGGNGVQAQWEQKSDWYIEINSSSHGISGLFIKNIADRGYGDAVSCKYNNISGAFYAVKAFIERQCINK